MARQPHLDRNERAFLLAFEEVDPDAENWNAGWQPELVRAAEGYGADAIARSFEGSKRVCGRLASRKLLDSDGGRGNDRGFSINDKGKAAIA